jgi:hypothetical protein
MEDAQSDEASIQKENISLNSENNEQNNTVQNGHHGEEQVDEELKEIVLEDFSSKLHLNGQSTGDYDENDQQTQQEINKEQTNHAESEQKVDENDVFVPAETETSENSNIENYQSNEFSYFSLDTVRPEELDDSPQNEDNKNQSVEDGEVSLNQKRQVRIDSIDLENAKDHELIKKFETQNATNDDDVKSNVSDDSLKNLAFDEIIDRVKQNLIANKDVCNYVLNLLVGGEFDMEKNFIITKDRNILLMIQVIKCARPALKVILLRN